MKLMYLRAAEEVYERVIVMLQMDN